ncbi:MAG: hypothetical protein HY023_00755 [Chloroflexi bacterium]|nr:hypothetical protein [Chloroflexota bacterium]MBI3764619.1 hypothetical protein [Chloroflexota bacterium]
MLIDKELYRKAYESYRRWNEAELLDRVRNAGKLTPEKAWRQYVELWQFATRTATPPSERQRWRNMADLQEYYSRVRKLEEWRAARGYKA